MEWLLNATPRPLYCRQRDPAPIVQEAKWAPGSVWTGAENLAFSGIRFPDRPDRSESLPCPTFCCTSIILFGQMHFDTFTKICRRTRDVVTMQQCRPLYMKTEVCLYCGQQYEIFRSPTAKKKEPVAANPCNSCYVEAS
jgi:hypothetical protein